MPKFNNLQTIQVPGNGHFQFSAIRPDALGATEYTLVTIVVDITASVASFSDALLDSVKSVIKACQRSPRVDNLLVRLVLFNSNRQELHGFVPLGGMTALYDAVYDAVAATNTYAQTLFAQDFEVNAAIYIITDGMDNCSTIKPADIAAQVQRAIKQECLETLITVLVGVDTRNAGVSAHLQLFKDEAQLSQFVDVADANAANLAKLGQFVSHSISLQSQALNTGAGVPSLSF